VGNDYRGFEMWRFKPGVYDYRNVEMERLNPKGVK
jgi:hypothetical protein